MSDAPQNAAPRLAERLAPARVGVRQDLKVDRQLYRGRPGYVVSDPVTFQSHRLEPHEYEILVAIRPESTLGEIFQRLVEDERLPIDAEDEFYTFVTTLHRLNLLNLPISDEKLLYQRFEAARRARRHAWMRSILFFRVPLLNPDDFLSRTIDTVRPLFSRAAFVAWCVLMSAAAVVAALNLDRLMQPLNGVLTAQNLPLIWLTLVVLKVFHEFGHAWACKHFGGYVPEMGAYFILFTPCAYVDATSCWGFPRHRDRIIVCLAGMYVESIFAALALFVWALTGPSLLNSLAYNVMFLASVVTILFNINPLMRYDGYYVASDLLQIPNLRQRSSDYVLARLKRLFLGLRSAPQHLDRRLRAILMTYGVASTLYRVTIVLAIAAMIASRLYFVGLAVALVFVGGALVGIVRRLVQYLWHAEETARVRRRAVALSMVALIVAPALVLLLPIHPQVIAAATLAARDEQVVRAEAPGLLLETRVRPGDRVEPGAPLALLENELVRAQQAEARAALRAAEILRDAWRATDPARAERQTERIAYQQQELAQRTAAADALELRAGLAGRVVETLTDRETGRYIARGEPIARVIAGPWQVRAYITEEQMLAALPAVGDAVEVRSAAAPGRVRTGRIARITPGAARHIDATALTHLGGGDVAVDPLTGRTAQPYFELTIDLPDDADDGLAYGMTSQVKLRGRLDTLGRQLLRRLIRFTNSLKQG